MLTDSPTLTVAPTTAEAAAKEAAAEAEGTAKAAYLARQEVKSKAEAASIDAVQATTACVVDWTRNADGTKREQAKRQPLDLLLWFPLADAEEVAAVIASGAYAALLVDLSKSLPEADYGQDHYRAGTILLHVTPGSAPMTKEERRAATERAMRLATAEAFCQDISDLATAAQATTKLSNRWSDILTAPQIDAIVAKVYGPAK